MRKNGFTLIELLAVIIILSVILTITMVSVSKTLSKSENNLFDTQVAKIIDATELYYIKEGINRNETCVNLSYLIEKGYIDKDEVISPKTDEVMNGSVEINYEASQYNYKYQDSTCKTLYKEEILNGSDPVLSKGLTPILYDGTNWKVADTTKEWYKYANQQWANAVILNKNISKNPGDTLNIETEVKAMLVWVPRFEYKIEGQYGTHTDGTAGTQSLPGEIEVNFISSKTPKATPGYIIHPAFKFGDTKLNGLWIGKFETTGTADSPTILPNQVSLVADDTSKFFIISQKFNDYLQNMDSHMTRGDEWSSVVYLSQSKYGKYGNSLYTGSNKEIYQNKDTEYITGHSNGTPSTSTKNTQCPYNDITDRGDGKGSCGGGASTTGNITGIYDMSGGRWEHMMSVLSDSNGNPRSGYKTSQDSGYNGSWYSGVKKDGIPFPDSKYYNLYTNEDKTKACDGNFCYGHIVVETVGWYNDYNYNPKFSSVYPWISYGASSNDNVGAGVFAYSVASGTGGSSASLRVAITEQ